MPEKEVLDFSRRRDLNRLATNVPSSWRIASIAPDNALILPHRATPRGTTGWLCAGALMAEGLSPLISSSCSSSRTLVRERIKKSRQRGVERRDRVGAQFAPMIARMHLTNMGVRLIPVRDCAVGSDEFPDPFLRDVYAAPTANILGHSH